MISIIHGREILKTVTDANISGHAAEERRKSFDNGSNIPTMTDARVIIEGMLYKWIEPRLEPDHLNFFETAYII